ncbi:tyrosine-protein phosphatase non-receptor type substrate 1-like [Protopterus annectens]|uniref:tyrosine-protein phosphatase non-receptor type substrate 1-like n=1 Tax=Protopterus annectens TaxID=7888 RepID=UPI001CF9F2A8|nr:tyrosine-protein phosphatase non-receptor type substrate 1-like [Protopterus annectens]
MQYLHATLSVVFLLISSSITKGSDELTVWQIPCVTGIEGESVIMNCTLSNETLGPVKWYKGDNRTLIYSQITTTELSPRIIRAVPDSATRNIYHSINITNITSEDAGMYYCMVFNSDKETVATSGLGTQLHVCCKYKTIAERINGM